MIEQAQQGWTDGPNAAQRQGGFNSRHLIQRAGAAWERDDYAAALSDFEQVLATHPDFPDIRNWAGVCQAMLGHPDGALREFDHAIRLNPRYSEAHLNRAVVLCEMGRTDEADDTLERIRQLDADTDDPFPAEIGNRIAEDHSRLGDLYLEAGRPDRAAEEFRKALEVRPGFVDVRNRLAEALVGLDELGDAVAEWSLVLAEHPSFLDARVRMGAILHRMGRTEDAIAEWRRCLEIDPGDRRARAYLISAGVDLDDVEVPGA